MRRTAALIVGGGPAGAAAAITLARSGVRPLLIERDAEPHDALCGGFLSWRTLERLRGLGLDPAALGGETIGRVRLFAGDRSAEAALPGAALGLSRKLLDAALLDRARNEGVKVERGIGVRAWEGRSVRTDDGAHIAADAMLLATGKHDLRGLARPREGKGSIGLRMRLGASPLLRRMLAGAIELHLFRGGYVGLLLQEDGTANLCLAANRERLAEVEGRPDRLLAAIAAESPMLGERLGAAGDVGAPQAIAAVPYGFRARETSAGLFRLGDQAAVIPSLAGEGIAIALASGVAAADALRREGPMAASAWQTRFARTLDGPFRVAGVVRRLAARPAGARLMVGAVRLAPPIATLAARLTRVD